MALSRASLSHVALVALLVAGGANAATLPSTDQARPSHAQAPIMQLAAATPPRSNAAAPPVKKPHKKAKKAADFSAAAPAAGR
jgi:hypothetical protein